MVYIFIWLLFGQVVDYELTDKFGVNIVNATIIKCRIATKNNYVLDLRRLKDYTKFVDIYREEFLPLLFHGELISRIMS